LQEFAMTPLDRMRAALTQGTDEVPAVVCYPGILLRDQYAQLTRRPWWDYHNADPVISAELLIDLYTSAGIDWYGFGPGASHEARAQAEIVVEGERAFRVNRRTGERIELEPPVVSGTLSVQQEHYPVIDDPAAFLERTVTLSPPFRGLAPGEEELPALMMASDFGRTHFAYYSVGGPIWSILGLMGYEQALAYLATDPEPLVAAARRVLANVLERVKAAAAAGCHGVWIEDCMTDMIGPERFAAYNLPLLQELVQGLRDAGLYSVYYFCGNPWPYLDLLTATGADALSLEESKKGFAIDIEDVVARTRGRIAVLGNLDAIGVLEQGSRAELRREVGRQLAAGRRNHGRFLMSIGSPVTPGTPIARVREYVELVRTCRAAGPPC